MKKLLLLMFVVGFSLSFSACEDDQINEIRPEFNLPDIHLTDGEEEDGTGVNNVKK